MVDRSRMAVFMILVLALVVGIGFYSWSALSGGRSSEAELNAALPILLVPEVRSESMSTGTIELKKDARALLNDFPVGEVVDQSGTRCFEWDHQSVYTGEATWAIDDRSMITVLTPEGEVLLGPYRPARSQEVVWDRFGVPTCGDVGTMWYKAGVREEL